MDETLERVETDSTIDLSVDIVNTPDPDVEFRAPARDDDAGQLLAGRYGAMAVGTRTDMDARQATDPNILGHLAVGFTLRGDPAATLPSVASEAVPDRRGTVHSTLYPSEVAYYGPLPPAAAAAYVSK